MSRIVVVGSLNRDVVATAPRLPGPGETVTGTTFAEHAGGKGLNQAIAAARAGASTAMVGAVGDDHAGRALLDAASTSGVDTSSVRITSEQPTGRAVITVDQEGENCIVVVPGANGTVDSALAAGETLDGAAVVLCQLEIPLGSVAAALATGKEQGAITMLDPAPVTELPDSMLATVDLIAPNEHELQLLGGIGRLLDAGVGAVLVTLGGAGAELHTANGDRFHQPAFNVAVTDTTGAGDAFRGALASRLAAGTDVVTALPFAAAAGALATTVAGAVPSLPRQDQIETLVASGRD